MRLKKGRRNSILMTRHHADLGCASDWLTQNIFQPMKSISPIWAVARHQYGISVLVSQTSFGWETSGDVAKCPLFSQAPISLVFQSLTYFSSVYCYQAV